MSARCKRVAARTMHVATPKIGKIGRMPKQKKTFAEEMHAEMLRNQRRARLLNYGNDSYIRFLQLIGKWPVK